MMQYLPSVMKFTSVCAIALTVALCGVASAQDPTGDWDIEINMGGTPMAATLVVTEGETGTYSGSLKSPMGDLALENVMYAPGESLSFDEQIGEGDAAMTFKFEGTFSGPDNFEGVLESSMGPMEVKGTRAVYECPIAGIWTVTSDSQLGTLTRDLVVYKSGAAKYVTEEQSFDISDLSVEGDAVTFQVTLDIQDQEMTLAFEGTHTADALTGQFMADGSAVAEVSGKRAEGGGLDSVYGEWEMRADTPLGELVAALKFGADASSLTTDEGESAITELDMDADMLTFAVTVVFEGGEYAVVFEGHPSEKTLEGDFIMDGSPVATVVATR